MAEERVGQQLGNYRLIQLLGRGGFAEVYLGEHMRLKTRAAIKVLHTQLAGDEIERFQREAQTIATLVHPHIVRVLDFDVAADGTPFLVMEYAPNGTLRQRHPKGAQLAPDVILPYVRQIADALQYAHDEKLVHRDIKPENLLLGRRQEIVLSDFGIALVVQSSRYQRTQEVAGTLAYMAPEQIQGHPRPASDQYALGVVLYEWLSGERPFHGSMSEVVAQHLSREPPPLREKLPSLSPMLEQVILTALAKDPKGRFGSVRAFATAFEQACQDAALLNAPTQFVTPSAPIGQPSAVITPVVPPISGPTPLAQQPTTLAVPPEQRPGGTHAPPVTSTPPGWRDVPPAAASAPSTMADPSPSSPRRVVAGVSAPLAKEPTQPKRRGRRPLVIWVSLILIVVVIAVSVAVLNLFSTPSQANRSGDQGTLTPIASSFQQDIVTGPHIISIQVGSGFDTPSQTIQGEATTFRVGHKVFVVCVLSSTDEIADLTFHLLLGSQNVLTKTIRITLPLTPSGGNISGTNFYDATITSPGVYRWEVDYNEIPEASITFQVVS